MSSIRSELEARERSALAPYAALSVEPRGRLRPEVEDPIRTAVQRDRDRVVHSKAFRRLKHKTQVFLAPTGDHYRTRLTHTLEMSQVARTIARVLCLNEDLTEAIALGHDLGHTPFGHAGEQVLKTLMPGGFNHYEQSLRVVDVLERNRQGLNLTWEVRNGIAKHSKGKDGAPIGLEPARRAAPREGRQQQKQPRDREAVRRHEALGAPARGEPARRDLQHDVAGRKRVEQHGALRLGEAEIVAQVRHDERHREPRDVVGHLVQREQRVHHAARGEAVGGHRAAAARATHATTS